MALKTPCIFNIYKPIGPTSSQVVGKIKRLLPKGSGKVGHFGTLDPFACGVLVIGVGGATRLNDLAQKMPKTYRAVGIFGQTSDTGDRTGQITSFETSKDELEKFKHLSSAELQEFLNENFLGSYMQAPHTFSAAKHEGKALYEWAREGKAIEKPPVERTIYKLEVVRYRYPYLCFDVQVSSGTYVRSLFQDIACKLGSRGLLWTLVRTKIGKLEAKNSKVPTIKNEKGHWTWDSQLLEHAIALNQFIPLTEVILSEEEAKRFTNGNPIALSKPPSEVGHCWVLGPDKDLLGQGLWQGPSEGLIPKINFPR